MARTVYEPLDFPGTEGKELKIRTNLFPLKRDPSGLNVGVYQVNGHRISFDQNRGNRGGRGGRPQPGPSSGRNEPTPLLPNDLFNTFCKLLRRDLEEAQRIPIKGYCTSNDNLIQIFVIPPLPYNIFRRDNTLSCCEDDRRRDRVVGKVELHVKYIRNVDFGETTVFNDFRELMKTGLITSLATLFQGNEYFQIRNDLFITAKKKSIRDILDVVAGMKVRVHTEVLGRPMLSINMTFTTCLRVNVPLLYVYAALILRQPITEITFHLNSLKGLTMKNSNLAAFREVVKGLEIKLPDVRNRTHTRARIVDITDRPASHIKCEKPEGMALNTFWQKNGFAIELPHMNAVQIKRGSKILSIPMEHCIVSDTPQKLQHSMSLFKKDIISLTAVPPMPRFRFIDKIGSDLNRCLTSSRRNPEPTLLTDLKMHLEEPISMTARVLDVPDTNFKENAHFLAMPYANKIIQYIFLDLSLLPPQPSTTLPLQSFIHYLFEEVKIRVDWRNMLYEYHFQKELNNELFSRKIYDVLDMLKNGQLDHNPEQHRLIFIVLLPEENYYDTGVLRGIGKEILTGAGFVSQFITTPTFLKIEDKSIRFNIALKINAKLGGINNIPTNSNVRWKKFIETPTMFMGIDTRNSFERKQRGVVAVAVSCDIHAIKYAFYRRRNNTFSRYSIQWKDVISQALDSFVGPFPERIFILRAGMDEYNLARGEGLSEIQEIEGVLNWYCDNNKKKPPKITYVGYNRAHNIRFMRDDDLVQVPIDPSYRSDPELAYNVPRGTVVDHTITHQSTFYLVTHATMAGTVKPAKYIITADDNAIPANDLLSVLYTLCCLTPRSNISIRRPLPIAYCALLLDYTATSVPDLYSDDTIDRPIEIHPELITTPFFV